MNRARQDVQSVRMHTAVEKNGADLLAYFSRRVTPVEDAADLLADTLKAVWRRVADVPADETRARMWMFGVARRVLANHRRGEGRRSELTTKLRLNLAADQVDHSTFGDHDEVWAAVAQLPPSQREVVMLVHGDGFTVTEAAKLMSTSASTTRTRYATGLQTLRTTLHEYSPAVIHETR